MARSGLTSTEVVDMSWTAGYCVGVVSKEGFTYGHPKIPPVVSSGREGVNRIRRQFLNLGADS